MKQDISAPERVQASFRRLSTAASSLNAVSDELRDTISELETALKNLNLGITSWVTIARGADDSGRYYWSRELGYSRIGHEWCVALRSINGDESFPEDQTQEVWPFNDAPRWMRVEGVGKIPELLEALIKQADDTAKKIKSKTAEARALTDAIKTASQQQEESSRK